VVVAAVVAVLLKMARLVRQVKEMLAEMVAP
jgi:hypothetical protein